MGSPNSSPSSNKNHYSKRRNKKSHTRSRPRVALHWKPEVIPVNQIVLLLGKIGLLPSMLSNLSACWSYFAPDTFGCS
jgi:hypothetical protein